MKNSENFLNEVIFQIKFNPLLNLYCDKKEAAWKFQKKIKNEFQEVEFEKKKKTKMFLDNTGSLDEKEIKDEFLTWIFTNSKKQIQMTGKELVLIYEGEKYTSFDEFLDDVDLIIKGLKEYDLKTVNSIGLRFINQIKINDKSKIKEYINPNLHLVNDEFKDSELIQSLTKTELSIEEYNLIFTYGKFNPEYPNITSNKEFVLDYDCILDYDEEIENVHANLVKMHDIISKRFKHDINDKLRTEMR